MIINYYIYKHIIRFFCKNIVEILGVEKKPLFKFVNTPTIVATIETLTF